MKRTYLIPDFILRIESEPRFGTSSRDFREGLGMLANLVTRSLSLPIKRNSGLHLPWTLFPPALNFTRILAKIEVFENTKPYCFTNYYSSKYALSTDFSPFFLFAKESKEIQFQNVEKTVGKCFTIVQF